VASDLAAQGVALFAISYDAIAILRDFAAANAITFPLLSDEGSHVTRRLGLINARVLEDHAAYGIAPSPRFVNLPYPGVFVLDRDGVVTRKVFHESYRERDSGGGLIAQTLGIFATPAATATGAGPAVTGRAWLDSPTYAWFQRLTLTVEIDVAPGYHVYGQPTPAGLVPLSVEIEPITGLEVGLATWPAPHRVTLPGLGDELWVHDGTVRGTLPLTFAGAPGSGDHVIRVRVASQACNEITCLAPSTVDLEVPVREVALVGRSLPSAVAPKP
jgi:Thiol:disulfide interchange protein DsbD, N-terminal/AhpC/TSA family